MLNNGKKFIVLEGLDGSGSSTQCEMLSSALIHAGHPNVTTSEPTNGPVGALIRQALQSRIMFQKDPVKFDEQLAYLFGADRYDHLYNPQDGVFYQMEQGLDVISTRYFYSSYAYHVTNDQTYDLVSRINKNFPHPDKLIYLDLSVNDSLQRTVSRKSKDLYEQESKLKTVAQNYQRALALFPGNYLRVDARKTKEEIHSQILHYVLS